MAGGMWPNCLGAVCKAGIGYPHQLIMRVGWSKNVMDEQEDQEQQKYSQHSMY